MLVWCSVIYIETESPDEAEMAVSVKGAWNQEAAAGMETNFKAGRTEDPFMGGQRSKCSRSPAKKGGKWLPWKSGTERRAVVEGGSCTGEPCKLRGRRPVGPDPVLPRA